MNSIVIMMDSLITMFFLFSFGVLIHTYIKDKSQLTLPYSVGFLLMFIGAFGTTLYDTGTFNELTKIVSALMYTFAGLIFVYKSLSEEFIPKPLKRLRNELD